jgi:hypothetical protein
VRPTVASVCLHAVSCFFKKIKDMSAAMSYKKKVPHIKGNEVKPYDARLILENRAKT